MQGQDDILAVPYKTGHPGGTSINNFTIATRPHLPGAAIKLLGEQPENIREFFAWKDKNKVLSTEDLASKKEVAQTLAKSSHRTCNGTGLVELSRVPIGKNVFEDRLEYCGCAAKNASLLKV